MNILKIISGELNQNNYIIVVNNSAILIDGSAKVEEIEENLKIYSTKPKIKAVLLTHEHFDHIAEVDNICRKYNCNMYIHKSGKMSLFHSGENLSELMGNVPIRVHEKQRVKTFEDGEELIFDDIKVRCLHTPGHSKGSSTFIVEDNMFTITVHHPEFGRLAKTDFNVVGQQIILDDMYAVAIGENLILDLYRKN